MPAYGTLNATSTGYKHSDKATVEIGGVVQPLITCLSIEHNTGFTPSRAFLRLGGQQGAGLFVSGPITLNRYVWPWQAGTKVVVRTQDGSVRFRGMLIKRRDMGQRDAIVWEAHCDKWLLSKIPLTGCLVRDPATGGVKYCTRYVPQTNPGGMWNCVGTTVAGLGVVPVFTSVAEIGKVYQSPDETFADALTEGLLTAWTPRRYLIYLWALANLEAGAVQGLQASTWRSLATSTRLNWLASSTSLIGKDAAQTHDPLDRKMPDMNFRGVGMLGAIMQTLEVAGTHGLKLDYGNTRSYVAFYPRGISGSVNSSYNLNLNLLRGGQANDINTIHDFDLEEDATQVSESVLVHGAPVHVETSVAYNPTDGILTLHPAWTDAEDVCCMAIIAGADDGSGTAYAYYPSREGSTTNDTFADGQSGRPLAFAGSVEAVALARQLFPHWRTAFQIHSVYLKDAGLTAGVSSEYSNEANYPVLGTEARPALPEQLQYFVSNTQRILNRYPVRIEVRDPFGANEWVGVPFGSGFRVTDNGWLWLDGLAESRDGESTCIYQGKLIDGVAASNANETYTKDVRINLAYPLDHRVQGYAQVDAGDSVFDPNLYDELGGPPLTFIDSPNAYREEHQVNSTPTAHIDNIAETDSSGTVSSRLTAPLNRYLPPGSEITHAGYAAERKLFATQWIKRHSSWSFVGIRPDYRLGQWVAKIKVVGGASADRDYEINAPIETMLDDFIGQSTTVGGLISMAPARAGTGTGGGTGDAAGSAGPRGRGGEAALMKHMYWGRDMVGAGNIQMPAAQAAGAPQHQIDTPIADPFLPDAPLPTLGRDPETAGTTQQPPDIEFGPRDRSGFGKETQDMRNAFEKRMEQDRIELPIN